MVIFQKILTSFTTILTFLSFSYSERFLYTQEHIGAICLFFLQKDFDIFHALLFDAFLCVFDNIYLPFLYLEKKFYKFFKFSSQFFDQNFLHKRFLHQNFFYQNFLHQNFLYQNQKKFLYINNILRNLFFFNSVLTFY